MFYQLFYMLLKNNSYIKFIFVAHTTYVIMIYISHESYISHISYIIYKSYVFRDFMNCFKSIKVARNHSKLPELR